jgi:hypothetical protein
MSSLRAISDTCNLLAGPLELVPTHDAGVIVVVVENE